MRALSISAAIVCIMAVGCSSTAGPKRAPGFTLPTLTGQSFSLADQKGKVVVMDFWATWCPPCRHSLPHLQKTASDADLAKKGLVVVAVNEGETPDDVKSFLADNPYTFTVLNDESRTVGEDYSVQALPTTIIIGRDGMIRSVIIGGDDQSLGEIDAAIGLALAQPPVQ